MTSPRAVPAPDGSKDARTKEDNLQESSDLPILFSATAADDSSTVAAETPAVPRVPRKDPVGRTWQERVQSILGPPGYKNVMRRSFQSLILFEARRGLQDRLVQLRPHQRKNALLHQSLALADSLVFLFPHQRVEIFWRTAVSREPLNVDLAWKRQNLVVKELEKLSEQIRPFLASGRSHQEACDLMMEQAFQALQGNAGKPVPDHWEHTHNHVILAFRLYYKGDQPRSDFPLPTPLYPFVGSLAPNSKPSTAQKKPPPPPLDVTAGRDAVVDAEAGGATTAKQTSKAKAKTTVAGRSGTHQDDVGGTMDDAPAAIPAALLNPPAPHFGWNAQSNPFYPAQVSAPPFGWNGQPNPYFPGPPGHVATSATARPGSRADEKRDASDIRLERLQEVQLYLQLLQHFEGAVPKRDLELRKKELFLALPAAPLPGESNASGNTNDENNHKGKRARV